MLHHLLISCPKDLQIERSLELNVYFLGCASEIITILVLVDPTYFRSVLNPCTFFSLEMFFHRFFLGPSNVCSVRHFKMPDQNDWQFFSTF